MKPVANKLLLVAGLLLLGGGFAGLSVLNEAKNKPTRLLLGRSSHHCSSMSLSPEHVRASQECERAYQAQVEVAREKAQEAATRVPFAWAVIAVGALCAAVGGGLALYGGDAK